MQSTGYFHKTQSFEEGFELCRIVVERNLEIISADQLPDIVMEDGDIIEVLRFVGGG